MHTAFKLMPTHFHLTGMHINKVDCTLTLMHSNTVLIAIKPALMLGNLSIIAIHPALMHIYNH